MIFSFLLLVFDFILFQKLNKGKHKQTDKQTDRQIVKRTNFKVSDNACLTQAKTDRQTETKLTYMQQSFVCNIKWERKYVCVSGLLIKFPISEFLSYDCPPGPQPVGFPYPFDCHRWVHCDFGRGFIKDCPGSLHFSTYTGTCDYAYRANCRVRG